MDSSNVIQMYPLFPKMMLAPQSRLWKWFLHRFTSAGGTHIRVPCVSYIISKKKLIIHLLPKSSSSNSSAELFVTINLPFHIWNSSYEEKGTHHEILAALQPVHQDKYTNAPPKPVTGKPTLIRSPSVK